MPSSYIEGYQQPFITTTIQTMPSQYSYLVNPPVAVPAVAEDIHEDDSNTISDGNYQDHVGEIWGAEAPQLDGCSLDTGRNTGIIFTKVGSGFTPKDDWIDPLYSAYGILMPDAGMGVTCGLVQTTADTTLRHECIVLRRGVPPVASTPTPTTCYTYLEFIAGGMFNVRLAMEYSRPVRLQFSTDTGATWNDVKQARRLSNTQDFLHMNNDCLVIKTFHDPKKNVFALKLANGITLMYKPNTSIADLTTLGGKLKLSGSNGWHAMTVFYNYHRPITVNVNKVKVGIHTNASLAFLVGSALTSDTQVVSGTGVSNDGSGNFSYSATVTKADDSGAGLGSSTPPRYTDGTLILPAYWSSTVPGGVNPSITAIMKSMICEETQVWDDGPKRIGTTSGTLYCNNYTGAYTGGAGVRACKIQASIDNNVTVYTRLTGVEGSGESGLSYQNPTAGVDFIAIPFQDKSAVMGSSTPPVVLGYEHQFDGWPLFSVVRYLCEKGNIHPNFQSTLPDTNSSLGTLLPGSGFGGGIYYPPDAPTTPPGTNGYAPYGVADNTCPYPILGRGVGDTPLYVFGREMTPWQVLQKLVSEEAYEYTDPITGFITYLPYMMYFDIFGYFHFEPYSPLLLTSQCGFTDNVEAARIAYPAISWFRFSNFTLLNSVSQMRSEITMQSIDALSNELLQAHLDMPVFVKELIGYYSNWVEGSGRWGEQSILNDLVLTAGGQASLIQRNIAAEVTFLPGLFAGQRVTVLHPYLGSSPIDFYINVMSSRYGHGTLFGDSGHQVNTTQISMRSIVNF